MKINKIFEYKLIKITKEKKEYLDKMFESHRQLYNEYLGMQKDLYYQMVHEFRTLNLNFNTNFNSVDSIIEERTNYYDGLIDKEYLELQKKAIYRKYQFMNWYNMKHHFTKFHSKEIFPDDKYVFFLNSRNSLDETLKRVDIACKKIIKNKIKKFHFIKYGENMSVQFTVLNGNGLCWDIKNPSYVKLGNAKENIWLKLHYYREIPETFIPKNARIVKKSTGYYIQFTVESEIETIKHKTDKVVGIDLNVKNFMAKSDGEIVQVPEFFEESKKIDNINRIWSNKTKRSQRWQRNKLRIQKYHLNILEKRKNFHISLVNDLCNKYNVIGYEDLQHANMTRKNKPKQDEDGVFLPNGAARKAGFNRKKLSLGQSEFITRLKNVGMIKGIQVISVNPRNTTQNCSKCGKKSIEKIELDERVFNCEFCGFQEDRDINAAKNVKLLTLKQL